MRVALFVTCLADLFRPSVGFAAVRLLEAAGCEVSVPLDQTCCGQPAYNSGDRPSARAVARCTIAALDDFEHVVLPSGSCAGMLRHHYPVLFAGDGEWEERAARLAERSHELTSFLVDVLGVESLPAQRFAGRGTYHDSCSSQREMGVRAQPRQLLASVVGLALAEMADTEVCCGFGGTFCVKFPDLSERMADDKIANIEASGVDTLLAGDLGCLLHLAGRLKRRGSPIRVFHVAEVLAGLARGGGIGEGEEPA